MMQKNSKITTKEEAELKAINILGLKPEHKTEVEEVEVFNTDTTLSSD